jgi:putative PIN family toxin of toxin-antitoxin system
MAIKYFVVDTNILVSAFVFKSKNPAEALKRCLANGKVVASAKTIEEFKSTLLAEKFDPFVSREMREFSLSLFIDSCDLLTPTKKVTACRDKDDNKFLEISYCRQCYLHHHGRSRSVSPSSIRKYSHHHT